jgi:hypothetical protein
MVGAVLTAAAIALPQAVQAEEGLVRLRVGAAATDYSLKFDSSTPDSYYRNKTAKSSYTAKNAGLTFVSPGGFYVDILGQTSGDATHDLWEPYAKNMEFSRDDFTLTLGVSIPSQSGTGSVFGGFKSGTTELQAPKGTFIPGYGAPLWSKDKFETTGFFFGGGYGFPAAGGQIGFNAAMAFMGGEWTDDTGYRVEADFTFGFSMGASYTYTFGKNFGLIADLKFQNYSYNFDTSTSTPYTITETATAVGLSLFGQF